MDISKANRIVIKIGSSLIADSKNFKIKDKWLSSLTDDVANLTAQGKEIIITSSGAVALGRKIIGKISGDLKLEEKQAAAACGQTELVGCYQKYFTKHKIKAAQILVTLQDSENRRRYLNARSTIETLLNNKIIPIINENDTVATNELRFGDNDRLAARVAQMISADLLIILSDVDGLYTANPELDKSAKHIKEVREVTEDVKKMAGPGISGTGSGGMVTKLSAAQIALNNGCNMIIADGKKDNPIKNLIDGAKATYFIATKTPSNAKKSWIATKLNVRGEIIIDIGAVNALESGKSLLPAGVIDVKGKFKRGDAITVKNHKNEEIGKGLSAYSSKDALIIMGHKSTEIEHLLGFSGRDEIIHRDDLALV